MDTEASNHNDYKSIYSFTVAPAFYDKGVYQKNKTKERELEGVSKPFDDSLLAIFAKSC
jgi:hypothetical protein